MATFFMLMTKLAALRDKMNASEMEEPIDENQPKSCEWVDREPLYIKSIGGMKIDRSEWEGDKGAFFRYKETPCRLAADPDHKFCPKHELQHLAECEPKGRA